MRPLDMRWSDGEIAGMRIPDELREPYILLGVELLGWLHNREVGFIRDHRFVNVSELYALRWIRSEEGAARIIEEMQKINWSLDLQLFGFEGKPVYRVRFMRNAKFVAEDNKVADVVGEYYSPWVYGQDRIDTILGAAIMALQAPVRFAEKFEEVEGDAGDSPDIQPGSDYTGDSPDIQPGSDYPL